jgi:hypothetical protein
MEKIELTQQEIDIIEKCINGEIDAPTGEVGEIVGDLLERALAYEKEIGSQEDPDDLLLWYYNKYKEQQNG